MQDRCAAGELSPCGVLWGKGALPEDGSDEHLFLNQQLRRLSLRFSQECAFLEKNNKMMYRSLRCMPQELRYETPDASSVQLNFSLQSGSYATSLLEHLLR